MEHNQKRTENMKGISLMSADEIRDLLVNEYLWDIEEMARDHHMTVREVTGLLQCGGDTWRKQNAPAEPARPRASYDVAFAPMVNVQFTPKDPCNLTEKEMDEVISLAVMSVADDFGEKISAENLSMIKLYQVEGDEPGTQRDRYIIGTPEYEPVDPEILVEVTKNLYEKLRSEDGDDILVSHTLIQFARKLTEKYKNTDWKDGEHDLRIAMAEECEAFLNHNKSED